MQKQPRYMKANEAARLLRCTQPKLLRLADEGLVDTKPTQGGGQRLYDVTGYLRRLNAAQTVEQTATELQIAASAIMTGMPFAAPPVLQNLERAEGVLRALAQPSKKEQAHA